ncbi:flagellar basal-body rod protein FlgG [Pelobacter propionicus]|uniref:Flagellar basal-body rod protein FlgG n=1 Tax=Pelobacter propionicus (strain DSM 2379 / NBRC 103807 / OttBd1) TaxID=338966 RepID=A1AUM1_PELPD|nr:flagellar basal-body rod protein FlgG [Pelobacter propionicus]ABL01042.1 flagellar basal-body rod protein FlgG [Pelobacter propionicus DSM 2379]
MMRALWTAASGMQAQQKNIDVVAHNLANVNTTGFKRSRADFEDLIYQNQRSTGSPATNTTQVPTGIQIGLGTRLASVSKLFTTGDFSQTGNELDIAIEGDGFFQIQMPDGTTAYSRAGAFKKDDQGRIVTPNGDPLLPEIVIPNNTTKIDIGSDGTVSATQSGQTTPTTVGTIQLALFANPAGLFSMGKNLYKETDSSGTPTTGTPGQDGLGTVAQGMLEMSNVSVAEEMVNMIIGQRAYEANSKAVQAADEMLQTANNLRR